MRIPHNELKAFGFEWDGIPFLPNVPGKHQFGVLVDFVSGYDIVIIQRCYDLYVTGMIKQVCEFLGIPCVFETDDDCFSIPEDSPAYFMMVDGNQITPDSTSRDWKRLRAEGLERYKQLLSMMDLIIVSTEELKRTIYPFNRNVEVFPNNIERAIGVRDHNPEEAFIERDPKSPLFGKVHVRPRHRLWSIPDYYLDVNNKRAMQVARVGYCGTATHRGGDFATIETYWEKLIKKLDLHAWFVYIGDPHFYTKHEELIKRTKSAGKHVFQRNLYIPEDLYEYYLLSVRNLDIAIAPLAPNRFNMSKSEIKAIEAASWGIPSVLPSYITYSRAFTHEENCLLYQNGREFQEAVELLVRDPEYRQKLGQNALQYVRDERIEKLPHNAKRRYDMYQSVIDKSYRLQILKPNKEIPVEIH